MKKKELPFVENPQIKTYPYFSNYLGVLEVYNCDVKNIIRNNFLLLNYVPFTGQVNFQSKKNLKKFMVTETYDINSISDAEIINFIKYNINLNKYIVMYLNDKYFGKEFKEFLGVHNWLILGYDDENELITIYGYVLENNCNVYKKLKIPYKNFKVSVVRNINIHKKRRISNNHIFYPSSEILQKNISKKKVNKINFLFISCSSILFLIIHNYIFARLKITPYKRKFIDLRDLRIIYEQVAVFINYFDNLSNELEKKLCGHTQNMMYMATKYNIDRNKYTKQEIAHLVNLELFQIWKLQKKVFLATNH